MCWHKWSKWELDEIVVAKPIRADVRVSYKGPSVIEYTEEWQSRKCEKCGRIQKEFVR